MGESRQVRAPVFIGGDGRMLTAGAELAGRGYRTGFFGFGGTERPPAGTVDERLCSSRPCAYRTAGTDLPVCANTLEEALNGADAVVLPLPASTDGRTVSLPLAEPDEPVALTRLFHLMSERGVTLLTGGRLAGLTIPDDIRAVDYYEREEFSVANAVPTAEGAIAEAMRALPVTLHGSTAVVLGYGRIGRALGGRLRALGMNVTATARKPSDLAWIRADGLRAEPTGELLRVLRQTNPDVLFNTIPAPVIGAAELSALRPGTPVIDLASAPGGVAFGADAASGANIIRALSLPGRVAPVTAGIILADTLDGIFRTSGGEGRPS